uniref:Farnesyl pyrophosphate synthase n=1 Tax=Lutzomyia longipalpis TaxID=7200 RepID=A0A1B0C8L8_LUTLO
MSRLCWYKHDDVQMNAINDAIMIEASIYQILNMEFSTYKFYAQLLELFHEGTFIATLGQKMNIKLSNTKEMNFTLDQYKAMAINETAWYSFYMPVACAMHLAGYKDDSEFRQTKNVLLEIGQLFQVQDDYLDCYGDPTERGTIGRDIEDGRFTWLLLTFLEHATDAQKAALKEAYGKKDPKSVERVKQLYNDVSLPKIYANYEEEAYKKIETKIKETTRGVPAEVYYMFLDSLFKRTS